MKLGTKSLLFGVHQFLWHPLTVAFAWRKLYRRWPNWWQWIAIFCHDLGYWGCPNMDGPEGREHPYVGGDIAGRIVRLFYRCPVRRTKVYWKVYAFTATHSRELSKRLGVEPSELCWADKYCVCVEPRWVYLLRARASGEIVEYMNNAKPVEDVLRLLRRDRALYAAVYKESAEKYWFNWYRNKVENLPEIKSRLATIPRSCVFPL